MQPHYRFRLYLLTALIVLGMGTLLTRLYSFQIERQEEFRQNVPGSRTVTVREPGIRGDITDRNGVVLAENLRNYEVVFNLEEIANAYRRQNEDIPRIERIALEQGLPRPRREVDIVEIVNNWIIKRLNEEDLRLAKNYRASALRTHYLTHGGLIPFSYRADLTYEEFARFAEHNLELPGVYVSSLPTRHYPYGSLGSHILGYLKPWEPGDIPEAAARKFNHYVGDARGIAGVEATMDHLLRGPEGMKMLVRNEKGQITGMRDNISPGVGATVELTIDAHAQMLVENVMRRVGRGAAVVMDAKTGEVLAMASVPDFDPNAFIPTISPEKFAEYNANAKAAPFTNRTIASFAPGSTFKVPTAIAGAVEGIANRSFSCDGFVRYGNHSIGCWLWNKSRGRHGTLNLSQAIQRSCNPYFNKVSNTIGWRAMVDGFQLAGFGKRTGIELPAETAGSIPGSRAWRETYPNAVMTPAEAAFLSIGQGTALASPLQLCAMTAAIANGGKYYQPRIIKRAINSDGSLAIEDIPKMEVDFTEAGVKSADLELIRKGMWMAVNQSGGTAGRVKIPNIEVAAKTGTAQTVDNGQKSHNSWLISFAPYEEPRYAICILVQNAGSGGAVCGPLANLIYRGLFARDEGMQVRLRPQTEFPGNFDRVEEIALPDDIMAAIDATLIEDTGDTGEEAGDLTTDLVEPTLDVIAPEPAVTPEVDDEGTIPRAIIVPEND